MDDGRVGKLVADLFLFLQLHLLLCKHAAVNDAGNDRETVLDFIWNINEASENANHPMSKAERNEDAVVAGRVCFVKAGMDVEAVATYRTAVSERTESLAPHAITVLRLA